jgi:hypothetical protein
MCDIIAELSRTSRTVAAGDLRGGRGHVVELHRREPSARAKHLGRLQHTGDRLDPVPGLGSGHRVERAVVGVTFDPICRPACVVDLAAPSDRC